MRVDPKMILCSMLLIVLVACSDPAGVNAPPVADPAQARLHDPDSSRRPQQVHDLPRHTSIRITRELQFPGVQSVQMADSWEHRIAQMNPRDREWLETVNANYAGALAFEDRKQQEWMIANGYPMPEEWVAARAMSDEALGRLAKSGNEKAQFFHIDRVAERASAENEDGDGIDMSDPDDQPLAIAVARATAMAWRLSEKSEGPFASFVEGRLLRANASYDNSARLAAGIVEAGARGDPRADRLLREFLAAHPAVTMAEVNSMVEAGRPAARPGGPSP